MTDQRTDERLDVLEDRIEALEAENRALSERVEREAEAGGSTRRQALGLLGGVGLGGGLAAASSPAAAASASGRRDATASATDDVHVVGPGESIQSAIDDADTSGGNYGVVRLHPEHEYDEHAEIHLRPRVVLDFNGARLSVSGDHNGIFVDSGARVWNAEITIRTAQYSSSAIVLDTARSADEKYSIGHGSHAHVHGTLIGRHGRSGRALELNNAAGSAITLGNRFDLDVLRFDTGVYANTHGGFINGLDMRLNVVGARIGIDVQGNGPFNNEIDGALQPGRVSEIAIRNETGNLGPTWYGQLFDANQYSNDALVGSRITVVGASSYSIRGNTDGAARQMGVSFKNGRVSLYDYPQNQIWTLNLTGNNFSLGHVGADDDREEFLRVLQNGKIRPGADGWLNLDPEDLRHRKPRGPGEIALAGQAATASNGVELAIAGVGGNWNTWTGDKIYPD